MRKTIHNLPMQRNLILTTLAAFVILMSASLSLTFGAETANSAEENRQLERARREVKLLDDIYKTAIVLITKHYVDENSDMPAGEAFKVLFSTVKEKGWHEVRLLDATGEPLVAANAPQD